MDTNNIILSLENNNKELVILNNLINNIPQQQHYLISMFQEKQFQNFIYSIIKGLLDLHKEKVQNQD